ncbi:MAG: type IX secretion system protein PorQ [Tannerella sp.]|nr:type IX secretion system protein PorQ [Tannerella sp.]
MVLFCCSVPAYIYAQNGNSAYNFLRYPTSSRVSALGGYSVSLVERDASLVFHNPALLGGEMDGMLNFNYMNYISDINVGSAVFTKAFRERSSWGIGATYVNYGRMKETTPENVELGVFSVQDISVNALYAYDLSDTWRGGLSLKALYSALADYSSFGLAVDAGLSYFDSEKDLALGIVLKNIGAQLKAYDETRQRIPWDIQMGMTKRMAYAPLRLSVTAIYLNRWKFDYLDNTTMAMNDGFWETALKHLVLGVEFVPSDNFWLGFGFNPKTKMDMKLASGNGLGGFSVGGGIKVSRFNVGASVARYHPSATSLMVSVSMSLSETAP